jgi:colicin import membrane protein
MFRSWKSAIGRAGEMLNDESTYSSKKKSEQVASGEPGRDSSPLGRLLGDLKASEGRRNGQHPNPEAETASQAAPVTASQAAPVTAPQTAPATAPQLAKVETAMPNDVQSAPVTTNGALDGAQRLIAEQRKAAEALLSEVCALEERLKGEAKAAQAAQAFAAANEKAKAAVILEQQAKELAASASESHRALVTEHKNAETKITDLKQQLSALEARTKECAAEEIVAERKAGEAKERIVACQAASVAAQKEAKAAEEHAAALKKELPESAQNLVGINEVQTLAARIAEQASALTRS